MRIPIEQILPDPDLLTADRKGSRGTDVRDPGRISRPQSGPVVKPDGKGRYLLLAGTRQLKAAKEAGEKEIECAVRPEVSAQDRDELRLAELYQNATVPPMELGRAFMKYRDAYNVTQQELARRTGITPGTIHHYESLIRTLDPFLGKKVDTGELTFKEARSIADILDHRRQREIAAPFLDGRLSSVHVERVVGRAKSSPDVTIAQLIDEALNGTRLPSPEPAPIAPTPAPMLAPRSDADSVESAALRIAGELDSIRLQTIPEYRRLKLSSSLRILDSRLHSALVFLNGNGNGQQHAPERLSR